MISVGFVCFGLPWWWVWGCLWVSMFGGFAFGGFAASFGCLMYLFGFGSFIMLLLLCIIRGFSGVCFLGMFLGVVFRV